MIQVAFAGHNRANDLGHHPTVIEGLDAAFRLLRDAGASQARLLTGLATGADELAADAWRRAGLGPTHAVFPFLDDPDAPPISPEGLAQTATWLDGAATELNGRNPHLRQTRLIVETSDLLVVVWTGERARGAGGTADAVRSALEMGLPVLWIKPSAPGLLRLIRPEDLPSDFDFTEFLEALNAGHTAHIETASPDNLRAALNLDARKADEVAEARSSEASTGWWTRLDNWLHGWLWKTYGAFRRAVGGPPGPWTEGPAVPADLASQPGFVILTQAYLEADRHANRLAAVHRSEQILLVFAMVTAALVGSSPAVWPELKVSAVMVELMLGLGAFWVWSSAAQARQHERWSEERALAEQLRLERAGWALGVSLVSTHTKPVRREHGDVGQDTLRNAGLPEGRFDPDRVRDWGRWAMFELVNGQSAYHRSLSSRDGRIAHRIHLVENTSFVLLLIILSSYLVVHMAMHALTGELPHWVSGVVTMASTIVPAVAAATMALEAKLEFNEQSERSQAIAERLDKLAASLGEAPSFSDLQGAARTAMRWHLAQESHWREGAGRRRLFRP
ncbi:MAG TPA: hypothetical protein VFW47_06210 [Phenylobacterium sp.]|nr:hypothetical protein [Phenylobacterium sp.]